MVNLTRYTLTGSILFSAIGGYWSNITTIACISKHSFIRFE